MAAIWSYDRVQVTTTTTGTSDYTLGSAVSGYDAFPVQNGRQHYYVCTDGVDYEHGIGTYNSGVLSRDTVLYTTGKNTSGTKVNWGSGTKTLFACTPPEWFNFFAVGITDVSGFIKAIANNKWDIAIGYNVEVTGGDSQDLCSFAAGVAVDVNASGSQVVGSFSDSKADWSSMLGHLGITEVVGSFVHSGGNFGGPDNLYEYGAAQTTWWHACAETTNNTPTRLAPYEDVANHLLVMPNNTFYVRGNVVARQMGGTAGSVGDSKVFQFEGAIKRDSSNNTALMASITPTTLVEDAGASGWSLAVTADDTNDALHLEFTGETDKTIRVHAHIEVVNVGQDWYT